MDKFLFGLLTTGFLLCLKVGAGVETVELPQLDKWTRSADAKLEEVAKSGILLVEGRIAYDKRFQAKYGECIVVTLRYAGKGRLRINFTEYDRNGTRLVCKQRDFSNPYDELHSRSAVFDVTNKSTVSFGLELTAFKPNLMHVQNIMLRRMYGEENALYSPSLSRELWNKRIQGKNLAAGLKLQFIPEPDYALTKKNGTDATDLTDGNLSTRYRDAIWFDSASVAWENRDKQCRIIADLGSVRNVSRAVIRICGGRLESYDGQGWFPELIETWISRDGKTWHHASSLKKVKVNERADADWKHLYYLPELEGSETPSYVYPFQFDVNAEARYIALIFTKGTQRFVTDELAIIEGTGIDKEFNSAYASEPNTLLFNTDPVVIPYYPEFYVPRKLMLPNWFKLEDYGKLRKANITYSVNLPEQISYTADTTGWPALMRELVKTEKKNGRVIYHFKCMTDPNSISRAKQFKLGPFYFRAEGNVPEKEKYVEFATCIDGGKPVVRLMKLNIIDKIPEVPRAKHLLLSIPWFSPRITASWPDFFTSAEHIGFNGLGYIDKLSPRHKNFVENIRKKGFKLLGVPHVNFATIAGKEVNTIKCDNNATVKAHNAVCPAYRGKYYKQFCDIVEAQLKTLRVDYVHLDFELWFHPNAFRTCKRCDTLRKSQNMDWPQYAEWSMADFYKEIIAAARRACPEAIVGSYMFCADRKQSVAEKEISMFGVRHLYPNMLDELHTPYYGPDPAQVNRRVRANLLYTRDPKKVVAYLTGGAGAYYLDQIGENVKFQLLEAYMNGAYGIAYYNDRSFTSPVDFFYIAEGMKAIIPYDGFLVRAELIPDFKGSTPNLTYTFRREGKKGLVLVGNYGASKNIKTFLPLPGAISAKDCFTSADVPVSKNGIELEIPGGKAGFIEVNFK